MKTETYKFVVPEYALGAIINGCFDSLNNDDLKAIDRFFDTVNAIKTDIGAQHYAFDFSEDGYFSHFNGLDSFCNTCYDCTVTFFIA